MLVKHLLLLVATAVLICVCVNSRGSTNADVVPDTDATTTSAAPLLPHDGIGVVSLDAVFKDAQNDEYTVVLFYRRADRRPSADMPNITLVSHATLDRLPAVERWCRTLKGPMSISVFVRPLIEDVAATMAAFAADACIARHADLHLVREKNHTYDASFDGSGKDMMTHYPFNVQRNAALDGCVGQLTLLMDIDFHLMPKTEIVPLCTAACEDTSGSDCSRDSDDVSGELQLRRHFRMQQRLVSAWSFLADDADWVPDAAVYVIPAVETLAEGPAAAVPSTLAELSEAVRALEVVPFYHTCATCQRPTNLQRFLAASEPYLVEFRTGYEPYVILNRSSRVLSRRLLQPLPVPRYAEQFVGRGFDKISFFHELDRQLRPFVVLPGYFLVHVGHGDTPSFVTPEYMDRQDVNMRLWRAFLAEVEHRYDNLMATGVEMMESDSVEED